MAPTAVLIIKPLSAVKSKSSSFMRMRGILGQVIRRSQRKMMADKQPNSFLKNLVFCTYVPGGDVSKKRRQLGECLECGKNVHLLEDGTMWAHTRAPGQKCLGSRRLPSTEWEVCCSRCDDYVCINSYDGLMLRHCHQGKPCPGSASDDFYSKEE